MNKATRREKIKLFCNITIKVCREKKWDLFYFLTFIIAIIYNAIRYMPEKIVPILIMATAEAAIVNLTFYAIVYISMWIWAKIKKVPLKKPEVMEDEKVLKFRRNVISISWASVLSMSFIDVTNFFLTDSNILSIINTLSILIIFPIIIGMFIEVMFLIEVAEFILDGLEIIYTIVQRYKEKIE